MEQAGSDLAQSTFSVDSINKTNRWNLSYYDDPSTTHISLLSWFEEIETVPVCSVVLIIQGTWYLVPGTNWLLSLWYWYYQVPGTLVPGTGGMNIL